MSQSSNLRLPYLLPSQAQKHVTHNEALRILDAVVQVGVASRGLSVPPAAPAEGDRYIVAAGASGDWLGNENAVAAFTDGAWMLQPPRAGWIAWVIDEAKLFAFDGAAWQGATPVNPAALIGVNTTAAAPNRLAVKSDAALFSHDDVTPGSGDMRLTLNKAAVGNAASLILQDAFSGRAEIGLAGDDKLRAKVSADGASWTNAFEVDPANGYFVANSRIGIGAAPTRVFEIKPASGNATVFLRAAGKLGCEIAHTESLYFSVYDAAGSVVFNPTGATGQHWFYANGALRALIGHTGSLQLPTIATTASAANAFLDAGNLNNLLRSTSSLALKRNVEPADIEYSRKLMALKPIWYRSKARADDPAHSFWGFAAEEVAAVDPRMVSWGYRDGDYDEEEIELRPGRPEIRDRQGRLVEPAIAADTAKRRVPKPGATKSPDGVAYERFVVHHHMILNDLAGRLERIEERLATPEARPARSAKPS